MEREKGIEPSCQAWKACVLPLNYSRNAQEMVVRRGFGAAMWDPKPTLRSATRRPDAPR